MPYKSIRSWRKFGGFLVEGGRALMLMTDRHWDRLTCLIPSTLHQEGRCVVDPAEAWHLTFVWVLPLSMCPHKPRDLIEHFNLWCQVEVNDSKIFSQNQVRDKGQESSNIQLKLLVSSCLVWPKHSNSDSGIYSDSSYNWINKFNLGP